MENGFVFEQDMFDSWCGRAYGIACAHGFHDESRSVGHCMMLVVTEISEMVEADRKNRHADIDKYDDEIKYGTDVYDKDIRSPFEKYVKDTFEDEMADVVIRICDFLGMLRASRGYGIPNVDVDMQKEYECIFASMTVCEQCYELVRIIAMLDEGSDEFDIRKWLGSAMVLLFNMARAVGIDLSWYVERKMEYNEQRPRRHGKQY